MMLTEFFANEQQGHINNLYNTAFWKLIQLGGLDNKEAEKTLAVRSWYQSGWNFYTDLDAGNVGCG